MRRASALVGVVIIETAAAGASFTQIHSLHRTDGATIRALSAMGHELLLDAHVSSSATTSEADVVALSATGQLQK